MDLSFLPLLLPLGILTVTTVIVLFLDIFSAKESGRSSILSIAVAGMLVAAAATCLVAKAYPALQSDFILLTPARAVASVVVLLSAVATAFMARPAFHREGFPGLGEFYALLVLCAAGMHLLCLANEMITIFIAIETMGLCAYVLAGFRFRSIQSQESAFKYFLLAAFSGAFLIMGMAFIYGATGTTMLGAINEAFATGEILYKPWAVLGLVLIFTGFAFKLTFAPFHMYAPDVYTGAPLPSTSLIATGSKVAAFMALINILGAFVPASSVDAAPSMLGDPAVLLLTLAAVISMAVGNLGAFIQTNVKRLLAYSSISHAGYAALGLIAYVEGLRRGDAELASLAIDGFVYYLIAYAAMTILAFGALTMVGEESCEKSELQGLSRRSPLLAAAIAVAMISLTGIPPTVGFFGKFQVFAAAVRADHVTLALIGVVLSILSAYYYLHVIVAMYFAEPEGETPSDWPWLVAELRTTPARLLVVTAVIVVAGPAVFFVL